MNRSRGSFAATCAAALCGFAMAACGAGTSGETGGGGTGGTNGSGTVGAAGGTVSLPSGPSVVVPSGALPADKTITVVTSASTAPAGAVSSLYQFGPAGTTFTVPVTVSFPVSAGTNSADVAVYWTKPGSTTEWDVLPATVSGTTATASVTHFSIGFVGAACAAGAACTPANACHTGITTCNGTPACADTGASVGDGAACGGGNVCTAGVCGSAQCTAGLTCTPPTTPDACKTYATACDAGGVQACVPASSKPDGTVCGIGSTCTAGTCSALSCNPTPITGSIVSEMRAAAGSKPTPLGGTIADGVYDLTSDTIFNGGTGATGRTERCTLVIAGTVLQEACGFGTTAVPTTANFVVSGNHYSITSAVCGTADVGYTVGFTATATQLWTIADPPGTRAVVYTRRDAGRAAFSSNLQSGQWTPGCHPPSPVVPNAYESLLTFTETAYAEQSWTYANATCSGTGTPGTISSSGNIAIGQAVNTTMGGVPVTAYEVNWSGPGIVGGTYYDLFYIDTSTTPWGLHIGANDQVKNGGSPATRPTIVSTDIRYTRK
jgi:hypothetical protein